MKYSKKQINDSANQIMNNIFYLIENKWIKEIYNIYKKTVDEIANKFGCVIKELDHEKYNRLFLELISYSLSLIIYFSSFEFSIKKKHFFFFKMEADVHGRMIFREAVASLTRDKIIQLKIDQLKEIVFTQLEPEIQFGYSDKNIDFWRRVNEYAAIQYGSSEKKGKDVEIFGKYIGKALDAKHCPALEIIGGSYAMDILEDITVEVEKAFC